MTESPASQEKEIPIPALQRIMSVPPVTVAPDASLSEAAELMLDRSVGSLLVVDSDGQLIGIVTDTDFAARRAGIPFSTLRRPQVLGQWLGEEGVERVYEEARRRSVGEVMSRQVHSVAPDASVEQVLRTMLDRDIKHVPVVEEGRAVGMIARHDLLKMMLHTLPTGESALEDRGS
ncbi:MAG: CBS domain-containing protein [Gemmatimonadota bacterium]